MTTIYLIRHSVRMPQNQIESYNTIQNELLKNEKIILSIEGEKRAEILSKEKELQNIDVVYSSNCVRALQTAKYIMESQNLKVNIDERLDERRVGIANDKEHPNWFEEQYYNENFKTVKGESQKEVRERFDELIKIILKKYKNKRIAIFSHGYAITFYLLKYCELVNIKDKRLKIKFKNKIVYNNRTNAPEVFKLTFNDEEIINIEYLSFDKIPYNEGK